MTKLFWYWSTNQIIHYVVKGRYLCNGATGINLKGKIRKDVIPQGHICKNCLKHFESDGSLK